MLKVWLMLTTLLHSSIHDAGMKHQQLSMFDWHFNRLQVWICHFWQSIQFCLLWILTSLNFFWTSNTSSQCNRRLKNVDDSKSYSNLETDHNQSCYSLTVCKMCYCSIVMIINYMFVHFTSESLEIPLYYNSTL